MSMQEQHWAALIKLRYVTDYYDLFHYLPIYIKKSFKI